MEEDQERIDRYSLGQFHYWNRASLLQDRIIYPFRTSVSTLLPAIILWFSRQDLYISTIEYDRVAASNYT